MAASPADISAEEVKSLAKLKLHALGSLGTQMVRPCDSDFGRDQAIGSPGLGELWERTESAAVHPALERFLVDTVLLESGDGVCVHSERFHRPGKRQRSTLIEWLDLLFKLESLKSWLGVGWLNVESHLAVLHMISAEVFQYRMSLRHEQIRLEAEESVPDR